MQEPDDGKSRLSTRATKRRILPAAVILLPIAAFVVVWLSREPTQDGKPISYWIEHLDTEGTRAKAALEKLGPKKAVPYLLKAMDGKLPQATAWERVYARIHRTLPASLRQRLPTPVQASSSRIDFMQRRTGYYFVQLAEEHPSVAAKAVPQLVSLLESANGATRFSAGVALSGLGSNAVPAIPMIEKLLRNDPEKIHDIMLHVLEKCGPEAKRTFPTLQHCLAAGNGRLSIQCARTLWQLDPGQADLVRPLALRCAGAEDAGLRIESASLLWKIDQDPTPVVPVLIGLLNEDDHPFDYRTILLLKRIGSGASNAIPALNERLKRSTRKEAFFLKAAEEALRAISGSAPAR